MLIPASLVGHFLCQRIYILQKIINILAVFSHVYLFGEVMQNQWHHLNGVSTLKIAQFTHPQSRNMTKLHQSG